MWGDIFINPNLPGFLIPPPLDQADQRGLMFFIGIGIGALELVIGVIIGGKFS